MKETCSQRQRGWMWLCGNKNLFFLFWDRIWECGCLDLRNLYLLPNYIKPNGSVHGVVIHSLPSLYSCTYKYSTFIRFATFSGVGNFYLFSLLE